MKHTQKTLITNCNKTEKKSLIGWDCIGVETLSVIVYHLFKHIEIQINNWLTQFVTFCGDTMDGNGKTIPSQIRCLLLLLSLLGFPAKKASLQCVASGNKMDCCFCLFVVVFVWSRPVWQMLISCAWCIRIVSGAHTHTIDALIFYSFDFIASGN